MASVLLLLLLLLCLSGTIRIIMYIIEARSEVTAVGERVDRI